MNCVNHPDRLATKHCSNCQAMLCAECVYSVGERWTVCAQCDALLASRETASGLEKERAAERLREEDRKLARQRRRHKVVAVQIAVIVLAVFVVLFQMPRLSQALAPQPPLRIGTFQTDALTDECIANLWRVAKVLQNGELPDAGLVCPASEKPFDISEDPDGDLVARSPAPYLYGFSEIRVSKDHPVPELIP